MCCLNKSSITGTAACPWALVFYALSFFHWQTGVTREQRSPLGAKTMMFEQTDEMQLILLRCFLFLAQNALNVKRCFPFPLSFSPPPSSTNHTRGCVCVCNLPPPTTPPALPPPLPSVTSHDSQTQLFSAQIFAELCLLWSATLCTCIAPVSHIPHTLFI